MSREQQNVNDPFWSVAEDAEIVENNIEGLKCEIKTIEARYDSKGKRVFLHAGVRYFLDDDTVNKELDSALVLTKFYDESASLEYTEMVIRSPYIKAALQKVVPSYPGVNLQSRELEIRDCWKLLFHYHSELQEYRKELVDLVASQHISLLLQYLQKTLEREMRSYKNHVESPHLLPCLEYSNLWMAFRPGDLVYTNPRKDEEKISRLKAMRKYRMDHWHFSLECLDYDGEEYGDVCSNHCVLFYTGYKTFDELKISPLRYHPNKDSIRDKMISRGKRFVSLHGVHARLYDGTARGLSSLRKSGTDGEEDEFPINSMRIKGRIIVDAKSFFSARPSHSVDFSSTRRFRPETGGHLHVEDDDYLIFNDEVRGYSLVDKRWCYFKVNLIHDIDYSTEAFQSLVLPEELKKSVIALVSVHQKKLAGFDFVVKGKGKGIISSCTVLQVLVKRLQPVKFTVYVPILNCIDSSEESVADFAKRPLYTMSAGDLGVDAYSVEKGLSNAMELASTWNAIILIDEADVFLQERSLDNLQRNSIVSVFLRMMELYEGIMFLTTNRVGSFDPAVKSRIHLAIKYDDLSESSRRDLWCSFVLRSSPAAQTEWLNDLSIEQLAKHELNGREIRNIVHIAHALAASEDTTIKFEHIRMGLTALKNFENDLEKARKTSSDDQSIDKVSKKRRLE